MENIDQLIADWKEEDDFSNSLNVDLLHKTSTVIRSLPKNEHGRTILTSFSGTRKLIAQRLSFGNLEDPEELKHVVLSVDLLVRHERLTTRLTGGSEVFVVFVEGDVDDDGVYDGDVAILGVYDTEESADEVVEDYARRLDCANDLSLDNLNNISIQRIEKNMPLKFCRGAHVENDSTLNSHLAEGNTRSPERKRRKKN